MADLTQPEPQKIDLTRLGSKIFDPDPSLASFGSIPPLELISHRCCGISQKSLFSTGSET